MTHERSPRLRDRVLVWACQPCNAVLLAFCLFLVAAAFSVPVDRKGDGSEYILATESLYFDHDLVVDNRTDIFRLINLRPQAMDAPAGLTRIPGADGVERYGLHSFYYPLLAVPFYAAFGYSGFYVLNALLLGLMVATLYAHFRRTHSDPRSLAFVLAAVLLSASWAYVFWTQTEVLYTALIALFLHCWFTDRPLRAAGFGCVAFGAQLPLGLLAVPFLIELLRARKLRTALLAGCILLAGALPQLYYNVHWLGAAVPMRAMGLASLRYVSLEMWGRLLVDPSMGLVWFYPVVVYCAVRIKPTLRSVSLLLAVAGVLLAMTSVRNIYSHQVGSRYANYALPVFLFLVDEIRFDNLASRLAAAFTVVFGAGLAINPLGNSRNMDVRDKTFLAYHLADSFGLFEENPEVFRVSSDVLVPDRVYARRMTVDRWTLGGERAELLLIGAREGAVELDLKAMPGQERQAVEIVKMSGVRSAFTLAPGTVTRVAVALERDDVRRYRRWDGQTFAYLTIRAQAWSPAIAQEGHAPEAHDLRRLGVNVESIALDGEVMLGK